MELTFVGHDWDNQDEEWFPVFRDETGRTWTYDFTVGGGCLCECISPEFE